MRVLAYLVWDCSSNEGGEGRRSCPLLAQLPSAMGTWEGFVLQKVLKHMGIIICEVTEAKQSHLPWLEVNDFFMSSILVHCSNEGYNAHHAKQQSVRGASRAEPFLQSCAHGQAHKSCFPYGILIFFFLLLLVAQIQRLSLPPEAGDEIYIRFTFMLCYRTNPRSRGVQFIES